MKAFPLNFLAGVGFCGQFHRFLSEKPGGLHEILVCWRYPHGEMRREAWVEKLAFCAVFIYLFICLLCVYLLLVCSLLFNYFKEAVCWLMHQLCGLAPWSLEGYLSVLVGYFWLVLLWIWCRIWWKDCLLFKFIVVTVYSYLYYC